MAVILWIGAGVIAFLLDLYAVDHQYSEVATASLSLLFGIWAFWRSGGPRITAAGVYCLAMSVYVGFAGLWWAWNTTVTDEVYLATLVGYWTTVAMYLFFWHRKQVRVEHRGKLEVGSPLVTSWGMRAGLVVGLGGFAFGLVGFGNPDQLALGGLAFLMVALILRQTSGERILKPAIAVGAVVGIFWLLVFSGGGRLNLVMLALVGVVVVSMRSERRVLKALLLLAAAPAVALLGWIEKVGSQAETVGQGLASVVNPLMYFGELVVAYGHGLFQLGSGETFLTTVLFWVPRPIWPDKPDGFGAVLSDLLRPELEATNNSLAALSFGEWFYDFGWIGVVLMIFVVGLGVRWLDDTAGRIGVIRSRRQFLGLVVVALLVAGIPTFAWVGSFTYVTRSVQQLLPIVILALPWASKLKRSETISSEGGDLPLRFRPGRRSAERGRRRKAIAPS